MTRILVTGRNGQLGFELARALAPLGEVVALDRAGCDLADPESIRAAVRAARPDVIVNAGAYTAVDKAESDQAGARAINAEAPRILGEEAALLGALVVHYSTDYVFDGTKAGAYAEDDRPNPQNVYGQTKLDGEIGLARVNPRHLVFRTSWVVGAHGGNFAKTMLRLAGEREQLSVVADQFGAPTSAALLADLTAHVVQRYLGEKDDGFPYGVYHLAAGGSTNWCEYARFVVEQAAAAGHVLKTAPQSIHPIATAAYPTPARRPLNSRLDTGRFRNAFGLRLPEWQDGVLHVLQQIL